MTTTTAIEREAWVDRARDLAALVAEWRAAGDQQRQMPRPLFTAIRDAELFRLTAARSLPLLVGEGGEPRAFYLKTFLAYAALSVASVALGIGRDAMESFRDVAARKIPAAGTSTLATQHSVHERIGHAEALLSAARAFLTETVRTLPVPPNCTVPLSDDLSARARLASAYATQSAAEAVDLVFNAAGTSAIALSGRLARCFRAVHVVQQHVAVAPSYIEMVGQYLLGFGLQARR